LIDIGYIWWYYAFGTLKTIWVLNNNEGGDLVRNRIMMAAIEEINENGIKFTMADLATRLAVSKSTLYTHFTSKEEMIGTIMDVLMTNMKQQDEEIMNNKALNLQEKMKALLLTKPEALGVIGNRLIIDLKRHLPEEWKKIQKFQEYKWEFIEIVLNQGIIMGDFRSVDLTIAKVMFNATVNELMNQNFLLHSNLTLSDAIQKMVNILFWGIMAPSNI